MVVVVVFVVVVNPCQHGNNTHTHNHIFAVVFSTVQLLQNGVVCVLLLSCCNNNYKISNTHKVMQNDNERHTHTQHAKQHIQQKTLYSNTTHAQIQQLPTNKSTTDTNTSTNSNTINNDNNNHANLNFVMA
ncbi:unnamed protein product [Polarella glacialis]|uniref:Uncharacterized protein n=1 Tax=Polarella glacialis TaxID=89957 RepID=A0A813G8G7_POLGL|nr:unnamed protein product [Polarella glacialis]